MRAAKQPRKRSWGRDLFAHLQRVSAAVPARDSADGGAPRKPSATVAAGERRACRWHCSGPSAGQEGADQVGSRLAKQQEPQEGICATQGGPFLTPQRPRWRKLAMQSKTRVTRTPSGGEVAVLPLAGTCGCCHAPRLKRVPPVCFPGHSPTKGAVGNQCRS